MFEYKFYILDLGYSLVIRSVKDETLHNFFLDLISGFAKLVYEAMELSCLFGYSQLNQEELNCHYEIYTYDFFDKLTAININDKKYFGKVSPSFLLILKKNSDIPLQKYVILGDYNSHNDSELLKYYHNWGVIQLGYKSSFKMTDLLVSQNYDEIRTRYAWIWYRDGDIVLETYNYDKDCRYYVMKRKLSSLVRCWLI